MLSLLVLRSTCTNVVFKLDTIQENKLGLIALHVQMLYLNFRYSAHCSGVNSSTCTNVVFKSLEKFGTLKSIGLYMYKCCI